ncbi:tetratricopeptide repeat-containing sensor histidine kinase [Lewinella sp. W8]|uniref:tetratricopeptide repeat-containing sensor histidine kinase n=1 Tax=Lewinella sp. W8 TaxID=2528208 RepID=UPI001068930A|nr:tetratricopeptide repeat-containing sensor histidine kinase [Lewinella sp. W8]MTB52825.1 tetratricopeptide repeat protein [Lewinella sp. W8]
MRKLGWTLPFLIMTVSVAGQDISGSDEERLAHVLEHAYEYYSADFDTADSLFRWAVATAESLGRERDRATSLKFLGVVNYLSGRYPAALEHYQESLSAYEALDDPAGQAAVLNEMGNFFRKREERDRALAMFTRAGELALRASDSTLYATSLDLRGILARDQQQLKKADSLWQVVLKIRLAIQDSVGLGYVYDNLATLAAGRGATAEAIALFEQSIQLRRQLDDRQGEAIAINNQGEAYLTAGDTSAAIPYLTKSLTLSRQVGFTDLQQWTMGLLAEAYAAEGQLGRALKLQRASASLKDSLYSVSTTTRIAEMQEKYEAEKRALELAGQRAQLRQRTAWLVAASLGFLLLLFILVALVRRQRQRRQALRRQAAVQLREDRLRISRDLHDHLGAELGIIASDLGRLARQPSAPALDKVTGQVRFAMEQMRETIWAVRLEAATWADLFARLREFSAKLSHPNVQFFLAEAARDVSLTPLEVLELYRFGQEAIRNAVRHAGAGIIRVEADENGLCILDDGHGFDPEGTVAGFGLHSLRERAEQLGADFSLTSRKGGGTRVELRWRKVSPR